MRSTVRTESLDVRTDAPPATRERARPESERVLSGRPGARPSPLVDTPVRTAVVVAAGRGRRLGTAGGRPKGLEPVVGVPLLARILRAAARCGVRRFRVVIGHQADTMRRELPALVPEGCELELVTNPRHDEPNGVSLLAAARVTDEPFVLLMSDHLFDPRRLAAALRRFAESGRSLLVVDPRERFAGDLADATLVKVEEGLVASIGKGLERYDAIDTGMFVLLPGEVRRALEEAGESPSISDGMRILAREGRLEAFPVELGWWQDVDTPADLLAAEERLFESLRKPNDGLLAALVNRRVSLFLTRRLWATGITPNQVSLGTLALGLGAGLAFAQGSGVGWGLLGATLFQLQSIVDGVDGELARLLHKESRAGFWLDVSVDNVTHAAVFAGIAHGLAVDGVPGPWGPLGAAAVAGVAACFALMAPLLGPAASSRRGLEDGLLRRLVEGLGRRDFTWLLFPVVLLGWLGGFLQLAALGTWAYAAIVLFLRLRARATSTGASTR